MRVRCSLNPRGQAGRFACTRSTFGSHGDEERELLSRSPVVVLDDEADQCLVALAGEHARWRAGALDFGEDGSRVEPALRACRCERAQALQRNRGRLSGRRATLRGARSRAPPGSWKGK